MKNKIAVVGGRDSVMLFNAAGLEVRCASDEKAVEKAIHALAREGYPVIYITEEAAEKAPEAIKLYERKVFPAIIPMPGGNKSKGLGLRGVKKNVEKAIGADILFGEGREQT
ncbi:MAG: V-type ATP synthase subunit F [Acidaminococcales bacterium]|jgi:V/A-type H+-transporting ATPase subunit F|nr:V-type ATP synthase subunit F [Acidaminococcales bacterium]